VAGRASGAAEPAGLGGGATAAIAYRHLDGAGADRDCAVRDSRRAINDVRLVGVAYDANTLRVIADADGTVNVAISSLGGQ